MIERDQSPELTWASERHLRVSFAAAGSGAPSSQVHQGLLAIQRASLPGLLEVTPAYATILLEFAIDNLDEPRTEDAVRRAFSDAVRVPNRTPATTTDIPVCYESSCAPDTEDVARLHGIEPQDLVRLHAQPLYQVQFIGFTPGFAYLSGLPDQIATPRLAVPRVRVPAGSVGIAGNQTGIYPAATAGGWRLIGRTPLVMFDAGRERPSLLTPGDQVRFVPIALAEFNAMAEGGRS